MQVYLWRPITKEQHEWFLAHDPDLLDCSGPACSSRCNEFNCWETYGAEYTRLFGEIVYDGEETVEEVCLSVL